MSYIVIMGMQFEEGSEPDFGSIYRSKEGQNGVHEYGLQAVDVSKLDLITNATAGSTALCDDSLSLYRLSKSGEWQEIGGNSDTWAAGIIEGTATHVYNANVTEIGSSAFYGYSALVSADFPNATAINGDSFAYCTGLTNINIPKVTAIPNHAFISCTNLPELDLPSVTSIGYEAFKNCESLSKVHLYDVSQITTDAFKKCTSLSCMIIENEDVIEWTGDPFNNTPISSGSGYIYFPDDLVDSYKAAIGWSTYAEQIKGLSELPEEEES